MAKADLKIKIKKAIDDVPEALLEEILKYINQVKKIPPDKINLTKNLGSILKEDKDLLQRLAL